MVDSINASNGAAKNQEVVKQVVDSLVSLSKHAQKSQDPGIVHAERLKQARQRTQYIPFKNPDGFIDTSSTAGLINPSSATNLVADAKRGIAYQQLLEKTLTELANLMVPGAKPSSDATIINTTVLDHLQKTYSSEFRNIKAEANNRERGLPENDPLRKLNDAFDLHQSNIVVLYQYDIAQELLRLKADPSYKQTFHAHMEKLAQMYQDKFERLEAKYLHSWKELQGAANAPAVRSPEVKKEKPVLPNPDKNPEETVKVPPSVVPPICPKPNVSSPAGVDLKAPVGSGQKPTVSPIGTAPTVSVPSASPKTPSTPPTIIVPSSARTVPPAIEKNPEQIVVPSEPQSPEDPVQYPVPLNRSPAITFAKENIKIELLPAGTAKLSMPKDFLIELAPSEAPQSLLELSGRPSGKDQSHPLKEVKLDYDHMLKLSADSYALPLETTDTQGVCDKAQIIFQKKGAGYEFVEIRFSQFNGEQSTLTLKAPSKRP
jgi:hypothetical protein